MENEQTEELWLAEKLEETPEKSWHLLASDAIRSPQAIMDEIAALDAQSAEVLQAIRALL